MVPWGQMPAALRPVLKPLDQTSTLSPTQIILPLVFRMRADALKKMPQPSKELKSSFYHSSLYFSSWSKIHVSWAKPPRKTTGFQLCPSSKVSSHTQPCHEQPSQSPVHLLSATEWSVWPTSWLRAQNLSKPKATIWPYQELASL